MVHNIHCILQVVPAAFEDFEKFGDRIVEEVDGLGREVERNPPSLIHYDAYGRRVDELITDQSWCKLHDISAEEGLISTAYRGPYGEWKYVCTHTTVHGTPINGHSL